MLVNAILIPYFLGIFTNVSKESDFDPEYLFEMNKVTVKYNPYVRSTNLSSRITCHPFQTNSLRCFIHNITHVTSLNRTSDINNRVEIGQWFEMKFFEYSPEIQNILVTEKVPTKFIKSFMKDIIHQFNIGQIADIRHVKDAEGFRKSSYVGLQKTPIGKCLTKCIMKLRKYKKDTNEGLDPNFQIRLLDSHFDQKDIHVHIKKNRNRDCIYSMPYADFLNKGEVTSYFQVIEVIENKLRMYTEISGYQSKKAWSEESTDTEGIFFFSQTMDMQLINIISQKTISFKDYNAIKFDY